MTVRIYKSTDSGAPTLTGQAFSLISLLLACLVDGYGSKAAAGWTKPYTGTNLASGNVLRFNVQGATAPIWIARCTLPGPIDEPSDSVRIELRGDAD